MNIRFLLFCGLMLGMNGPCAVAQAVPVDGYAAMVNHRVITVGEVLSALQPIEHQLRDRYTGRELAKQMQEAYEKVLASLIERSLMLEEFARTERVIPETFVDDQIQEIISERFNNDRESFLRALNEDGMSMQEWREDIRDRLSVMILRRQEVTAHVLISPLAVRAAYDERIDEFTTPAATHLRMIVIPLASEADEAAARAHAESIWQRLQDGESFEALAKTYSKDSNAAKGGDWGWIEAGTLRPELDQVAARLQPGGISDIVQAGDALYMVKLEERRERHVTPFLEVSEKLERELSQAEEIRIYHSWINRLRSRNYVKIFDPPGSGQDS